MYYIIHTFQNPRLFGGSSSRQPRYISTCTTLTAHSQNGSNFLTNKQVAGSPFPHRKVQRQVLALIATRNSYRTEAAHRQNKHECRPIPPCTSNTNIHTQPYMPVYESHTSTQKQTSTWNSQTQTGGLFGGERNASAAALPTSMVYSRSATMTPPTHKWDTCDSETEKMAKVGR